MVRREDGWLDSEGISLASAFFAPEGEGLHSGLVICHGLPAGPSPDPSHADGRREEGLSYPDLASRCAEEGFATLIFNFRGTGASGGNFHPLGWARDLESALSWMWDRPEVDVDRIAVLGSSMGGRVAIYVTARRPEVAALVTYAAPAGSGGRTPAEERVARFREIGIIRDADFPSSLEAWANEYDEMNPLQWIGRVAPRPLLLMHGEADDLVPPEQARQLYERASEPKELLLLPEAGHRFRSEAAPIVAALAWLKGQFLARS